MTLRALGYLIVGTDRRDEWLAYASGFLGLEANADSGGVLRLRMDERVQRVLLAPGEPANVFGWEVADAGALEALAARLDARGVAVRALGPAQCELRAVGRAIAFEDPAGQRLEAFCAPALADAAMRPGRPISGFRTGALGMGHAVLTVERIDALRGFYQDVLGFRVSDWATTPFKACFFHLNARHHSFAMIETGRAGVHHVMMEFNQLDDVGQAYDLALATPGRVGTTLGRHTNDFMTSFYARTPSDFMIEIGWGGRLIDPDTWTATQMHYGPSLWGHDRQWLPPEQQALARAVRARAAADGLRQPVQVADGNYRPGTSPPAWWER